MTENGIRNAILARYPEAVESPTGVLHFTLPGKGVSIAGEAIRDLWEFHGIYAVAEMFAMIDRELARQREIVDEERLCP